VARIVDPDLQGLATLSRIRIYTYLLFGSLTKSGSRVREGYDDKFFYNFLKNWDSV
jgi:hypothetical protein